MRQHAISNLFLFVLGFVFLSQAAPLELDNGILNVLISPESGGKIIRLRKGDIDFQLPPERIPEGAFGLGKERIFGDNGEYMEATWKVEHASANSITLSAGALNPPKQALQIRKTYQLPENAAWLKIQIQYRNLSPLEGSFKIIPWMHHSFVPPKNALPDALLFRIPHEKGIENVRWNPKIITQRALKNPGNWSAFLDLKQQRGLLIASDAKVEVLYDYLAEKICSIEFLYAALDPIQDNQICQYIAPVASLDKVELEALQLPLALKPEPAPISNSVAGESVVLGEYFKTSTDPSLPVNLRFWKSHAYVSPDIVLPLTFGMRTLGRGEVHLEFDLPDFLELSAHTGNYWWHTLEDMDLLSQDSIVVNGQNYQRYRFKVTSRQLNEWLPCHSRLLVRSRQTSGESEIYYRAFMNGQKTMEDKIPCKVIRIPKARQPEKFKVLFGLDYSLLKNYPDFHDSMRHLGINGLCLNYSVPNKVITPEQIRQLNDELKAAGFMTAVMGIFYDPPGYYANFNSHPELQAVDRAGKPMRNFDFTARGSWMADVAQKAIDKGLALNYDLLISDYEAYFGAEKVSFTERTLNEFREFFQQKYPERVYVDPVEIAGAPQKHPDLHKIWVDFKCMRFADYLEEVMVDSKKRAGRGQVGYCTVPGASDESIRMDNLIDNARFSSFLDYNMPMLYDNLYRTMPRYRQTVELFKSMTAGRAALIAPTLTIGFWGEGNPFPPEHSFYILLETLLTQCAGAYIFPGFAGSDNLGIYYLSQALDLIAHIEERVYQATRSDSLVQVLEAENSALKLPAAISPLVLRKDSQMLVYLAEYSKDPIRLKVLFNQNKHCNVKTLTGKFAGTEIPAGSIHEWILTPDDGKGLLLLLESSDGKPIPEQPNNEFLPAKINSAEEIPEAALKDLLFQDSFEGSTHGINAVPEHYFKYDSNGYRGKSLFLNDYESAWLLPQKFSDIGEELTLDFYYQAPRPFKPDNGMLWDIIRGNLSDKHFFWLYFEPKSGKICFAAGYRQANGNIDWKIREFSENSSWPENIWMQMKLNIGKRGIRLMVNGKPQIDAARPVDIAFLENLQIGRRFVSAGKYDELRLFRGRW